MKIDYWAQVNLGGFVSLVDSVGGVNINVTDGFCDPRYKEYGIKGFNITPGRYHMDGEEALAYARIRKALGESDFTRAGRQQEVIAALRDRLVRGEFLEQPVPVPASRSDRRSRPTSSRRSSPTTSRSRPRSSATTCSGTCSTTRW